MNLPKKRSKQRMRRFRLFVCLSHNGHSFLLFSRIIHVAWSDSCCTAQGRYASNTQFASVITLFVLLTQHAEIGSKFAKTLGAVAKYCF